MKPEIVRTKKRPPGMSDAAVIADAKRATRKEKALDERVCFERTRASARQAVRSGLLTKQQNSKLLEALNILDNAAYIRLVAVISEQDLADQRRAANKSESGPR